MVIEMTSLSGADVFATTSQDHSTISKIRSVSLGLFVQHGYEEVGLRQIAQQIGIQPGSLYNHIEGKEALLFDLIIEYDDALLCRLKKNIIQAASPRVKLKQYVLTSISFGVLNNGLHSLAMRESICLVGAFSDQVKISRNSRLDLLKNIIGEGVMLGEFCSVNEHLALIAIGSVLNGFVSSFSSYQHEQLERLAQMAYEVVLRIVVK